MAPPDPLTVLTPQELVQGLATACDTARCEEMQVPRPPAQVHL